MYGNLEIFILTYNRAKMFEQSLKSICEQSAEGFNIIICDNGSTDNTREVAEAYKNKYPKRDITFLTTEKNMGSDWNFMRAKELASGEWVMLFHDDDLLHPEYIKNAMELLAKTPDAVMASCAYTPMEYPDDENWKNLLNEAYIADVKDFAALMFGFILHNFASTIFKTDLYKTLEWDFEKYGKICDRPFLLDIAKRGKNIILKDPYVRYRVHPGQDTNTGETGPFENEFLSLMNCYKEILGNSWFDKYGIIYNLFILNHLRMGYHWLKSVESKMSLKEFKKHAAENNVIRKFEVFKIFEILHDAVGSVCKHFLYSR